ncbi:MAG: hypothetical protein BIP78_1140 [Candidatus Bipolaricaulis sibiricus]|uniref:DUF177 domain-containing protein n=1 Tax=Bipolaricaulis sibiricus TaxID=2501609 RepID=A0A410FV15_BIPS1|nr:MAG: hypothetical protein BIP78_1140 [Candidatus Bipolaricaulis sibiricus]
MKFDLEALRAEPGRPFNLTRDVELPDLEWQGEGLRVLGPVHVEASAIYQEGEFILRVSVRGRVRRTCSRCLVELVEDVHEDGTPEVHPAELEGRFLELHPFIEAGLRLGLSPKPLCTPGCLGICPECGADLNRERHREGCHGQTKRLDPRLAVLRQLLDEPPSER